MEKCIDLQQWRRRAWDCECYSACAFAISWLRSVCCGAVQEEQLSTFHDNCGKFRMAVTVAELLIQTIRPKRQKHNSGTNWWEQPQIELSRLTDLWPSRFGVEEKSRRWITRCGLEDIKGTLAGTDSVKEGKIGAYVFWEFLPRIEASLSHDPNFVTENVLSTVTIGDLWRELIIKHDTVLGLPINQHVWFAAFSSWGWARYNEQCDKFLIWMVVVAPPSPHLLLRVNCVVEFIVDWNMSLSSL